MLFNPYIYIYIYPLSADVSLCPSAFCVLIIYGIRVSEQYVWIDVWMCACEVSKNTFFLLIIVYNFGRAAAGIGLYVNAHKTEYMCYNQTGYISTLDGTPLKLVDKFTYLGSSVASTEKDIDTRLTKVWTAINRLSIIWKSDLTDKMKRSFFQAAVASILLYGCTTWTLTKRLEKKLDGNYTRMLRAILNKSWRQHPTRHQL